MAGHRVDREVHRAGRGLRSYEQVIDLIQDAIFVLDDREPNYLETPVRTVDGETVPCEVSGVAVADVLDGAQADVTGVVRRVAGGQGAE